MRYAKFLAEVTATGAAALVAALTDGTVTASEALGVVVLALGAVAVLGAGNLPAGVWAHTKSLVAAAAAGAVFLQSAITGGISPSEWLLCGLAVAGAIGVHAFPGPRVVEA